MNEQYFCAHCAKECFEAAPGLWRDVDGFTICWAISRRPLELIAHEPISVPARPRVGVWTDAERRP